MPSYEEADAQGNAPFVPPVSSGRLQAAPADLAKALGVFDTSEETTPSEVKDEEQGSAETADKLIENRSAKIQEKSEELYRMEESRSLKDPAYLQTLLDSQDPLDRKNAAKILKRNAGTFHAGTPEEYKMVQDREAASTPAEKKMVELEYKTQAIEQKQRTADWSDWKKVNSVGEEIAAVADDIHVTYPDMSYGDVLALARGRKGLSQTTSQRSNSSAAVGSIGAPETEESVYSSPLARRLIKNPESTMKFAKGYLRNLTS